MRRLVPPALLCALLGGCQGCGAATAPSASPDEPPSAAATGEGATAPPGSAAPPPAGPPPVLQLRGEPGRDGVELVLQNRDEHPVRLSTAVTVERAAEGGFSALPGGQLSLRDSCQGSPPKCVELVPGAELRPPPWRAAHGEAQCGCREPGACAPLPTGRYRFTVRGCETPYRVAGEAFDVEP